MMRYDEDWPAKSEIAKYWHEFINGLSGDKYKKYPYKMFIDPGEPDCWGCGAYDPDYPDVSFFREEEYAYEIWDYASLERHHILPRAAGGGNEPSNFVLLCSWCHREAPHSKNTDIFWNWLRNRQKSIVDNLVRLAKEQCELLSVDLDYLEGCFKLIILSKNHYKSWSDFRCNLFPGHAYESHDRHWADRFYSMIAYRQKHSISDEMVESILKNSMRRHGIE